MNTTEIVFLVIAVLLFAGAFAAYWVDTDKVAIPAILALAGVFFGGAQYIKASINGVIELEFAREVTKTSEATATALAANEAAIADLSTTLTASQGAFDAYRAEVDKRFAELKAKPVAYEETRELQLANDAVRAQLEKVEAANAQVRVRSEALKSFTGLENLLP